MFLGLKQNMAKIAPRAFDRCLREKKNLVGAEIGVFFGEHAWAMLENLDIKKLYLVDPYAIYPGYNAAAFVMGKLIRAEIAAHKLLKEKGFTKKIAWMRMESMEAPPKVKEKLDFVYIDANHDYEFVLDDITYWARKVKKGGWVGGHDYNESKSGVIRAVGQYGEEREGVEIMTADGDWFFQKL